MFTQLFKISIVENVKQVFTKINQNVQKSNDLFKKTNSTIKLLPNSIAGLNKKLEELKEKQTNAFTVQGIKHYRKEIIQTENEIAKFNKIAEKRPLSLKNMFSGIGKSAMQLGGAYIGINAIGGTIKGSIDTLAEFEKYKAVLANTLGSKGKAENSMNQINSFAATTPFQVNELTDSYVKLANQGFIPTTNEMTKLGDLASSTGKSFDQLTEAILDAQTGEFERLKEFGITAHLNGKNVAFTFKGVTKEVTNSGLAIRQYLLSLGNLKGVKGSMAAIMGTTGGQLSNFEDQLTMLKLSLGETIKPLFAIFIKYGSKGIAWLTELIKGLSAAIDGTKAKTSQMGGIFKTAFNVAKFIKDNIQFLKALTFIIGGLFIAIKGINAIMKIWRITTLVMEAAQWLLNIAMDANPVGAVIIGITALVALFMYAWKHSEKFRGTIVGIWEAFKALAVLIKDVVVNSIMSLVQGIGKIGLAIWSMLKGDFKAAWQNAKEGAVDIFKGTSFGVAYQLYEGKDKVVNAYQNGYDKGTKMGTVTTGTKINSQSINSDGTITRKKKGLSNTNLNPNGYNGTDGTNGTGNINFPQGNSPSIVGNSNKGGDRFLSINKLVEKIEIHSTNLTESTDKIKQEIVRVLLAAVNDTYNVAQ